MHVYAQERTSRNTRGSSVFGSARLPFTVKDKAVHSVNPKAVDGRLPSQPIIKVKYISVIGLMKYIACWSTSKSIVGPCCRLGPDSSCGPQAYGVTTQRVWCSLNAPRSMRVRQANTQLIAHAKVCNNLRSQPKIACECTLDTPSLLPSHTLAPKSRSC